MRHIHSFRILKIALLLLSVPIISFQYSSAQSNVSQTKGYGKAQYNAAEAGKFMNSWLIAGPFKIGSDSSQPDGSAQEKAFKSDIISVVNVTAGSVPPPVSENQKEVKWQLVDARNDIVDLDSVFNRKDFAYAYALAEIKATAPSTVMFAVGSDDGIKIWLNGKLVHDNWIPRGVVKDNDLVPLKLTKGSNQVLIKVQDMSGGWGFTARLLDKTAMSDQLNAAASAGNIEKVNLLIDGGADVNSSNKAGITPLNAAKISGRDDVAQVLVKKGAVEKPVPSSEVLVDNIYSSLKGKDYPGIAVLVAEEGKVLYKKGFGYADVKNKIPVTPDTKFRIGSVTKQFTAAAILKLQEKNLLSVNDKLSKFIPDFPKGDEVTIHQLLTHTSGIHSYTGESDFVDRVTKTISPDSLVAEIKRDAYDFKPGEKMMYNNSGYFLLGYIISKVSGKTYENYLKETFFDPLKMENTGVHYAGISLKNEAKGYSKVNNKYDEALNWDMSWAGAAGAMYSTVDDLLKWNEALYNGKVLSQASLKAAQTPAILSTGEQPAMQYGYGLMFSKYRGEDIVSHGGGLHGFITQLAYYPKEKMSIVMFSNTAEPDVNFDPNKIAEAFLWSKLEKQVSYTEASVKPANLQPLTGRYDLMGQLVINVTTENNKLFAQLSGQPKFEIFPLKEDEFFWKVVEARIKFLKDSSGAYNQAILFQNGQEMKAKRLPEEKIVQVNAALLDTYTGKYKLNDNVIVTVTKENNRLFAQPTNEAKVELLPTSDADFVIKELNAKISFVKDSSGKVNKFTLNMNGRNTELPRVE